MTTSIQPTNIRERVLAILEGKKPDRLPFIDRLEIWYHSRLRSTILPEVFQNMSIEDIHTAVGMGQQIFLAPYALRLRGVEIVYRFEGNLLHKTGPIRDGRVLSETEAGRERERSLFYRLTIRACAGYS